MFLQSANEAPSQRTDPGGTNETRLVNTFLLILIAMGLFAIAIRPYLATGPVQAQSGSPYPFYIEPALKCCVRRMAANRFTEELWWT